MSAIENLFKTSALPIMQSIFGILATRIDEYGAESSVKVIFSQTMESVGDFAERLERIRTIDAPTDLGLAIGDYLVVSTDTEHAQSWQIGTWELDRLIDDDGLMVKYSARLIE